MDELTRTGFQGGKVNAWQPQRGYRAGVDPVLLAASIPALSRQTVLELGCGVGVASLCLLARVPGLKATGIELQDEYAQLARRNAAEAQEDFEVFTADLTEMPQSLKDRQFHHVFANPPYFRRAASVASPDAGRDTGKGGETPLAQWVEVAAKRTRPKGTVTFIQRAERLPELIDAMQSHLGSLQLLPLTPRGGRDSQLVLLRARKNGRADFRLHAGLIIHEGASHTGDHESYTPLIRSILRDGAGLPFPD